MKKFEKIYCPEDDSKLLLKWAEKEIPLLLKQKNNLNIFEVGLGSGFVSLNLAKKFKRNKNIEFFGSDINKFAIEFTKQEFEKNNLKIDLKNCSFFNGFKKEKFDLILFNTPYLPLEENDNSLEELSIKDRAIYGGKKGYEVIVDFIYKIYNNLLINGKVIMIFSSLSHLDYIKNILEKNLYNLEILEEKKVFFEIIYVMKFWRNEINCNLFEKKIKNLKDFSCGKHSIILEGDFNKTKVIIKIGKEQHLEKEGFFLNKLKKEDFTPNLIFSEKKYVVYEKIEGRTIEEFFYNTSSKKKLIKVLNNILKMTNKLDKLKINKFEMTNPYKHIFVQDDLSVKMIDYERSIFRDNPQNTRQVLEFFKRYSPCFEKLDLNLDFNKILEISKKLKKEIFLVKVEEFL